MVEAFRLGKILEDTHAPHEIAVDPHMHCEIAINATSVNSDFTVLGMGDILRTNMTRI